MSITQIAALVCYSLVVLIAFVFSAMYLLRSKFMPYHGDAVEHKWEEVDANHQVLILALMRAAGGGWLSAGISMIFLLVFPYRTGELWSIFALPLVGLATASAALYAALYVKRNSRANPPVGLVGAAILLLLLGFIFSII
jgi:hypothetical protein